VGRQRELDALDRLLDAARGGHGGVLVVHGDPGVGKTALLDQVAGGATRFRVLRSVGVEGEAAFAYAGLQLLCGPVLDLAERLPSPQREALAVAFGLGEGPAPNPFLVGLAVLGLLSAIAVEQPVLALVDDAQWLDLASAQALGFVARRLVAEQVALVFATREVGDALARLPELHLEALGHRDARELLESRLLAPLDEDVVERLVVETRGNPLALVELPHGLTPAQLAGGFGSPATLPLHARIEESFARRLERLPADSRRLLLLAASDAAGDPALVWRAAAGLGISGIAADAVHAEGLVEVSTRIAFRHPLVRSAIYRAAEPGERRDAHRALAEATDPAKDPDRRAWHLAQATVGPDEEIAALLQESADRARARGGYAAAAAFLELAAGLTVDARQRAVRALAAATAKQQAGALDEAAALLSTAENGPLDAPQRAEAAALGARIAFAADRGSEAPARLLAAAEALRGLDVPLARDLYLDALGAALFAGRLAGPFNAMEVASIAQTAPPTASPRAQDLLLDGLALLITDGPAAGTRLIRQAVQAFGRPDVSPEEGLRWRWLAGRTAGFIWDYEGWDSLTRQQIRIARDLGALAELPLALSTRVGVHLFAGELRDAAALVDEADALADATDRRLVPPYGAMSLAAFGGREDDLRRLLRVGVDGFAASGEGLGLSLAHWVTAVLSNGMGRYEEAFAAALEATVNPRELWFSTFALVELIEAAARTGRTDRAAEALTILRESTVAAGTPWALGVEARSRALVSDENAAEAAYREATERLAPTRLRLDLARAHLLYGEWLRRAGRRLDARTQLRAAHDLFSDFGTTAFAERARVELEATGEHARKRTTDSLDELTPQEAQVARLAARGSTNRQIAAQLFISPSTVEYHLAKVFRKLDVTSRIQLARRLQ
jgi:DNA-binding CsgD family transcriptional regulator